MGLFKSIKKAFKKVGKAVKKVVKKVVGGVKKVVKKISSSKILKALAVVAAVIVTGGAALTAFGGTGALASSQFGTWMMSTSQAVLGGTAFGTGATSTLGKIAQGTGNFLAKTAAKPFGAVGGALGSTARVGANLLTPGTSAFAPGTAAAAPTPFSSLALTGQRDMSNLTDAEFKIEYNLTDEEFDYFKENMLAQEGSVIAKDGASFAETVVDPSKASVAQPTVQTYAQANPGSLTGNKWGDYVVGGVGSVIGGVATGYAQQELLGGDPRGVDAPLMNESKDSLGALQVYASNNNFNLNDIYGQLTYGTADPGYIASTELYTQDTIGVPS